MNIDIDAIIFGSFIIINLVAGLYYSKGVNSIKEYSIGSGNFTSITIAATLIATCISGSSFFNRITETYNHGLYDIWATSGFAINLLLVAWIFAPRLSRFLGSLSVAEAMGNLYGNKVRIITALCGSIAAAGAIAVQLKVAGRLIEYGFNIPGIYGVLIAAIVVALYSAYGGIRSVTFTDIIQLFTFGTIIPTVAFFIFKNLNKDASIINTLKNHELFDYSKIFNFSIEESFSYFLLFIFFLIPDFSPVIFQRIAMANNTSQIRKSFTIAGISYFFLICMMAFIGVLLLTVEPNLEPKNVVKHIILDYSYVGLKGLTLAGVMAMVMSTADSFINSTSVLIINDFCKPLKLKIFKNELSAAKFATVFVTLMAFLLTLTEDNLRNLMIQTLNFYFPVVSMPFILACFGFRTDSKCVLIAMSAGLISVITGKLFLHHDAVLSSLIGISINIIFLFTSHYILKAPGGWQETPKMGALFSLRQKRIHNIREWKQKISMFSFMDFLKRNTPRNDSLYIAVSIYCMITTYASVFTIASDIKVHYINLIEIIYPTMLFLITAILSYPLWPIKLKNSHLPEIVWNSVIFIILVCSSFFFVLVSNFASVQQTVFMINLILLSILLRWQLVLLMIITGVIATSKAIAIYSGEADIFATEWDSVQFRIGYLLLITSSIFVAFLKPKQDEQDLVKVKESYLTNQISQKNDELSRSNALKYDFINNLNHEVRTPLVGIISLSKSLYDIYKQLPPEQLDKVIKAIADNSIRLETLMNNLLDLSDLSNSKYQLKIKPINISDIIYNKIELCSKIWLGKKELEFVINIKENIIINADEHYISSSIENLITNAIKFSDKGTINITLKASPLVVSFMIKDQGVGIPQSELELIFEPFMQSTRTHTYAGGKGIGLALTKKAIELHGGTITAANNKAGGACFSFTIPIR